MRSRSLTTRLTCSHLLATTVALMLLGLTVFALLSRNQRSEMIAGLNTQAAIYATYASQLAPTPPILEAVADSVVRRFPRPRDTTVRIFATNGSLLSSDLSLGEFPSRPAQALMAGPVPFLPLPSSRRLYVARPILRGDEQIGIVELSSDTGAIARLRRELALALVPCALLAAGGALVLAHLLARSLLRPLHALGRVSDAIAAGNWSARADERGADEISHLAGQINRMAVELQQRFGEIEQLAEARRQFYRSVSHELRTPLTAIRGMAENLEDSATPEQIRGLAIVQEETTRLQRLVEELLAGGEHSFAPVRERRAVELAALVSDVAALMRPRAERGAVRLTYEGNTGRMVLGDRDRLKQALVNVVDNALKWTPSGGSVVLRVYGEDRDGRTGACVSVADTGPGIPEQLRATPRLHDARGDGSGHGLGLALVREVVEAHGGTVLLKTDSGTTVELWLPAAPLPRTRW